MKMFFECENKSVQMLTTNNHFLHLMIFNILRGDSLVAQTVKNLAAMQETCVWSLGWEDLLEKGMDTHSSILAWRIPWTEEPDRLQSMGLQRVRHDWATSLSLSHYYSGSQEADILHAASHIFQCSSNHFSSRHIKELTSNLEH